MFAVISMRYSSRLCYAYFSLSVIYNYLKSHKKLLPIMLGSKKTQILQIKLYLGLILSTAMSINDINQEISDCWVIHKEQEALLNNYKYAKTQAHVFISCTIALARAQNELILYVHSNKAHSSYIIIESMKRDSALKKALDEAGYFTSYEEPITKMISASQEELKCLKIAEQCLAEFEKDDMAIFNPTEMTDTLFSKFAVQSGVHDCQTLSLWIEPFNLPNKAKTQTILTCKEALDILEKAKSCMWNETDYVEVKTTIFYDKLLQKGALAQFFLENIQKARDSIKESKTPNPMADFSLKSPRATKS